MIHGVTKVHNHHKHQIVWQKFATHLALSHKLMLTLWEKSVNGKPLAFKIWDNVLYGWSMSASPRYFSLDLNVGLMASSRSDQLSYKLMYLHTFRIIIKLLIDWIFIWIVLLIIKLANHKQVFPLAMVVGFKCFRWCVGQFESAVLSHYFCQETCLHLCGLNSRSLNTISLLPLQKSQ